MAKKTAKKTAEKKKEGRGKDCPTDMPSEIQRMMIRDMHDFRITGFNPHDPCSYESTKFHQFRDEYKEHGYAVFFVNVAHAARLVRSHMKIGEESAAREHAKQKQEEREEDATKNAKTVNFTDGSKDISDMMQGLKFQPKENITDPNVAPYPCRNRLLILVELEGDVNDAEGSNAFTFQSSGDTLCHWSRVPSEWWSEQKLIGTKATSMVETADTIVLRNSIDERKKLADEYELEEEDGSIWEPRRLIHLPFSVEPTMFDKHNKEINSFLVQGNEHGYKWGYFWLLREGLYAEAAKKSVFTCAEDADDMSNADFADDDVSEATEECEDEEEELEDIEVEEVSEDDEDDDAMDVQTTYSHQTRSDMSYMREQWTEEIHLRKVAEDNRKIAEDKQKAISNALRFAENRAEESQRRANELQEERQREARQAQEVLRKLEEEKQNAYRMAEEEKQNAFRMAEEEKQNAFRMVEEEKQRVSQKAEEEKQKAEEEKQRVLQKAEEEKQRVLQKAEEEKQRVLQKAQETQQAAEKSKERAAAEKEQLHRELNSARAAAEKAKKQETEDEREAGKKFKKIISLDRELNVPPKKRTRLVGPDDVSVQHRVKLRVKRPSRVVKKPPRYLQEEEVASA